MDLITKSNSISITSDAIVSVQYISTKKKLKVVSKFISHAVPRYLSHFMSIAILSPRYTKIHGIILYNDLSHSSFGSSNIPFYNQFESSCLKH